MVMLKWQFCCIFRGQVCNLYKYWSESKICEGRFMSKGSLKRYLIFEIISFLGKLQKMEVKIK